MQRVIQRIHTLVDAPRIKSFSLKAPKSVISGRRHVGIMSAEPVGNYGDFVEGSNNASVLLRSIHVV
ncbi:hypothetical protein DITRI_Ditri16bG0142000 [Diplodiscus trichospermus]